MLDVIVEKLEEELSGHGVITNMMLRTEESLYFEEATREIEVYFAESEELDRPVAAIHLFPLEGQEACEIEVEITYRQEAGGAFDAAALWKEASTYVSEVSITEKKRFLSPQVLAESSLILDYHFVISLPLSPQKTEEFNRTLEQFATDLARLVRL